MDEKDELRRMKMLYHDVVDLNELLEEQVKRLTAELKQFRQAIVDNQEGNVA